MSLRYKTYLNDASEANKQALNNAIQAWYKGSTTLATSSFGIQKLRKMSLLAGKTIILFFN